MKWETFALSFCASLLPVLVCGSGDPPDLIEPRVKRSTHDRGDYAGRVTAVGPGWVEIGAGWEGETRLKAKLDTTKAKRFSAIGTTPGGDPKGEGESRTHLIRDLKVGDVVTIQADISRAGEEWMIELLITRRPGGKIPAMAGDQFAGTPDAFHLQNQAEQDWEEKGIPIPKKYLNKEGRAPWTNPPYPPVAPMPRVKP